MEPDSNRMKGAAASGGATADEAQQQTSNNNNINDSSYKGQMKKLLWHGGSVYDAWLNCASNQVAQVLLTLPYSFSQMGMAWGIAFQLFYSVLGTWTSYLITCLYLEYRARRERENANYFANNGHVIQWFEVLDGLLGRRWKTLGLTITAVVLLFGSVIQVIACGSNIYYINDSLDKRTWTYIFGACCALTVLIPSYHNYRVWSFLGLCMTTYTAWFLAIAAILHGKVEGVVYSGPTTLIPFFTGATNILYTFGGHAITVETMHAMWTPRKFKSVYGYATLYVLLFMTLPSATAMYWAFGDLLLTHSNAFSLLPKSPARDAAVVLMLIHQFIIFGAACTPLYFMWEKMIGFHTMAITTTNLLLRAVIRIPVVLPIWFLAIMFPFFGPINSAVGALLVTFTVYIIPAAAHMAAYRTATARENSVEKPPKFLLGGSWRAMYALNAMVVVWTLVVGVGLGSWASIANFVGQINTFGLFAKCYQCPPSRNT